MAACWCSNINGHLQVFIYKHKWLHAGVKHKWSSACVETRVTTVKKDLNQRHQRAWKSTNCLNMSISQALHGCSTNMNIYVIELLFPSNSSSSKCRHVTSHFINEEYEKAGSGCDVHFSYTSWLCSWRQRLSQNGSAHGCVFSTLTCWLLMN